MNITASFFTSDLAEATEDFTTVSSNDTTTDALVDQNGTSTGHYFIDAIVENPLTAKTYILFGLTCFVTILGLFGNSLILTIIFKAKNGPFRGHDILVSALAFFDNFALISTAISQPCVAEIFGIDIRALATVGCKVFMSVFTVSALNSVSVVVLICIERFVAVWYPLRARVLLSREIIVRALVTKVIAITVIYTSMSVMYSEIQDGVCDPNFSGKIYSRVLNRKPNGKVYIAMLGLQLMIYFILLLTLTPMILRKLYQQSRERRTLTATAQDTVNFHTSAKLSAVIVAFLLFVAIPHGIAICIGLAGGGLNETSETSDLPSFISLASLLNYSTNFLIYGMFDSNFRMIALSMFGFGKEQKPEAVMNTATKAPQQTETGFTSK